MAKELKIKEVPGDVDHIDCGRATNMESFMAVTICKNRCAHNGECDVYQEYQRLSAPKERTRG